MRSYRAGAHGSAHAGTRIPAGWWDHANGTRMLQDTDRKRQIYRRAASHSGRVRVLKVALPLVALVAVAGVVAVMAAARFGVEGVDVNLAGSTIVDGKLVMADPKLDGYTADRRAYRVAARTATQVVGESAISLEALRADVEMQGGGNAWLNAETGRFDPDKNRLLLDSRSVMETSDGLRAVFTRAEIDIAGGTLAASDTVEITRPGASIVAGSLTVEDNGKRLVFEKDVSVVIQPAAIPATGRDARTVEPSE